MPYAISAGAKVFFTDSGGDGPVVVLGHPFLMDHEVFDREAESFRPHTEALGPGYRVIAVDARGHGETLSDDTPFSCWDLARDAWAVVDHLGVDRVVAGGYDMGGFTALRMALLAPPRVAGLVLIGTSAEAYTPAQREGYRQVLDAWTGTAPLEVIAKMVAGLTISVNREDYADWLEKWLASDRQRLSKAVDGLINVDSIVELLGDIACPALLIRGASDPAFSEPTMRVLEAGLGGPTEFRTIEGAAHAVTLTHGPEVDGLILRFLDSLHL
ncbi:alpha/beta fold hydrolase [Nocardia concava]|uniref:alpha/beta fold hydrolase n=1 Tax=Nocardia concava TaxID=257281 RepID=UPI000317130D|nr:alpha/beta hydrolase [Nocardia concava]